MNEGKYVFSQIMELISYKKFQTLVNRHSGEYKVKDFGCANISYALELGTHPPRKPQRYHHVFKS